MTKEELEKEADKWLVDNLHSTEEDYKRAYLAGAEPRERLIVELKGLVNQYKASKCSGISLANRNMVMSVQLTKAKEIIKEFVEWANWQGNSKCPSFKSIQEKAEQFLREVEK